MAQLPEFRLFACFWGSMAVLGVGRASGAPDAVRSLCVTGVVAGCSLGLRTVPALAVGLIGWLFIIGFVVNDGGVLRVTDVGDLVPLVVLLAGGQVGGLAGRNLYAMLTLEAHGVRDPRRAPRPARAGRVRATVGKR